MKKHSLLLCGMAVVLFGFVVKSNAYWNLPYTQPKAYDYSAYYNANVITYLNAVPDRFTSRMKGGWEYYKANFIMSNGLVMHKRLAADGASVIGTNESVSEGEGYGMMLAVLNNDQTTFNKIFEAANANMWDASHVSYFKWSYPSGSPGAATDADIDICCSLIFADMLASKNFWKAYSNGGVTYKSRAEAMIKSIKDHMTSNNYLLPGDNWGSDGLNNLNPSYFSTGMLKVFMAYLPSVDFTQVINNCYTVLAKMPNYNKGQACDWISSSGGNSSKGMGMLSDGIRTPWRIGLDALWFNDARAIAYCAKSKGTLTQYANTAKNFLLEQMAQYQASGQVVPNTASFSETAMWCCAILGSKDKAYSTVGLDINVLNNIIGTGSSNFGSIQLKDHLFYFKQSIGLLGFAALTGQFPNILEDMKNNPTPIGNDGSSLLRKKSIYAQNLVVKQIGNRLQITTGIKAPYSVTMYSPLGKMILNTQVNSGNNYILDLSHQQVSKAAYILAVSNGAVKQQSMISIQ